MFAHKTRPARIMAVLVLLVTGTACSGEGVHRLLEVHAANKQRVLEQLLQMPPSALEQRCGVDLRSAWRRMLLDGACDGLDKESLLIAAMNKSDGNNEALDEALRSLQESHRRLFSHGANSDLMVRCARDPAFRPFGRHMSLTEALAEVTAGNGTEVQTLPMTFETGRNLRGYVHELECHSRATEFIYAVTDIVCGVMLPVDLSIGDDRITANPTRVQVFYIRAGEAIALHPYILHSSPLSVEPDRNFTIFAYRKPLAGDEQRVLLPHVWEQRQDCIRIADNDTFYLTLEELHANDLMTNCGFITGKEPLRLPTWE